MASYHAPGGDGKRSHLCTAWVNRKKPTVSELSEDEVKAVAQLARLALEPEEIDLMRGELGAILGHIASLERAKTDQVEPMTHATQAARALRDDVASPSLPAEIAVAQAPDRDGNFFRVPSILGEGSSD